MQLEALKTQALRYVVLGDHARAFRLYQRIIEALPVELDARMKVGDLLVTLGRADLARRVYAAVALCDVQGGRPLHALVVSQSLRDLGEPVLENALAALYGAGSPKLGVGREGARLAPPDPAADVLPPELAAEVPLELAAQAAAEVASAIHGIAFPDKYPPTPLLSELSPESFARVVREMRVHRLPHGARVVREGEPGESLFLVASGHLRVFTTDPLGQQTELARLGEGAIFGELSLVAAQPRLASVEVVGEANLLELGARALRAAAGELAQLAEALSRFTRDRLIKNVLTTSPLFRAFTPQQRVELARRFTGHELAEGTTVIREGETGRGLFVVLSGELEVVKGEEPFDTTVAVLRSGDAFGEIALIKGTPASATVRAARPSSVLFLGREYFERLMTLLPELRAYFESLGEERLKAQERAVEAAGAEDLSDEASVLL